MDHIIWYILYRLSYGLLTDLYRLYNVGNIDINWTKLYTSGLHRPF